MLPTTGRHRKMAVTLTTLGLLALPLSALAQDPNQGTDNTTPGQDSSGMQGNGPAITLDVENADLYTTLKLLFTQAKADYTLDPSLRSIPVTIHLAKKPFRLALEAVLRSSGQSLTYELQDGIYNIITKTDATEVTTDNPDTTPTAPTWQLPYKFESSLFPLSSHLFADLIGGRFFQSLPQEALRYATLSGGGFGGGGLGGGGGFGGGGLGGGGGGGGLGGGGGSFGGGGGGLGGGGGSFGGGGGGGSFGGGGFGR